MFKRFTERARKVKEREKKAPVKRAPGRRAPPKGNNGVGNGIDPQPPGEPPVNDGEGTGPGNPGNKHLGKRKRARA